MTSLFPRAVARLVADPRPDPALVAHFLRDADQQAFAEIVRRHGPLVLGVCRRTLGHAADADDAFQATFLVLVRRARHTAWRGSLGPWLYGVAVRVARKARAARARRTAVERGAAMTAEPAALPPEPDDAAAILDDELATLPEAVRVPLVLCELQGLSRKDAARQLGLAEGTLSSRLARGRKLLRDRLARRGVAPLAGGLCVAVPAELARATAGRAAAILTGAAGAVPAGILALTDGVVKTMAVSTWKASAVLVAAAVGLTGLGAWQGNAGPGLGVGAATAAEPPAVRTDPQAPKAVATVDGEPVSKEEFTEYLLRRHGAKELELFVNGQVVRRAFAARGFTLDPEAIEAAAAADAKALHMTREQFERDVLPKQGKTWATWLEDVVAPRLMLERLCGERAVPTEAEVRELFDEEFGEKVKVRVVGFWPQDRDRAREVYAAIKSDAKAFDAAAERYQTDMGMMFHHGRDLTAYPRVRSRYIKWHPYFVMLGGLKPGEVTPLVEDGREGLRAARCVEIVPADATKSFDAEKPRLVLQLTKLKLEQEIPKLFAELKRQAKPEYHMAFPAAAKK